MSFVKAVCRNGSASRFWNFEDRDLRRDSFFGVHHLKGFSGCQELCLLCVVLHNT